MVLAGKVEKESEVATTSKRNTSSYRSSKVARKIALRGAVKKRPDSMSVVFSLFKIGGEVAQPICLNESRIIKEKSEKKWMLYL